MADGVAITAGLGTTVETDEIAGKHHQRVKVQHGADGTATDASSASPLPVTDAAVLAKLIADPATQATLAAVLAKIIAAPATEAKQDSILTELGQKLEPGGEVALAAATLTALETISIGTALPAGTNNIGDVDVLTLPALPAGTNNIGDVDVASIATTTVSSGDATQVASSATSVTLKASNSSRKALWIFNDSTAVLHVRFAAAAASTTAKNFEIAANVFWEHPTTGPIYTGEVRGIWESANGNCYVTELA